MNRTLLEEGDSRELAVHVVWSSQLGATESHVSSAARLMPDPRVRHYWDADRVAGTAFLARFPDLSEPAWDVWMLFGPGVEWRAELPPEPDWWEHQLGDLDPGRRLDPERFARRARALVGGPTPSPPDAPRARRPETPR